MELGSHEVQVILTVTLLVGTTLLALFCDYLQYRLYRKPVLAATEPLVLKTAIVPTLVPEFELPASREREQRSQQTTVQPTRGNQASRLAAAMLQHQAMEPSLPKKSMRRAS